MGIFRDDGITGRGRGIVIGGSPVLFNLLIGFNLLMLLTTFKPTERTRQTIFNNCFLNNSIDISDMGLP